MAVFLLKERTYLGLSNLEKTNFREIFHLLEKNE